MSTRAFGGRPKAASAAVPSLAAWVAGLVLALVCAATAQGESNVRDALLHQTQAWTLEHVPTADNAFDVRAVAEFSHAESGERVTTDLFWIGDGRYEFRFTPTRTGRWEFETESDVAGLDGFRGEVHVDRSELPGALTAAGNKFAETADGDLDGTLHHPYHLYGGSDLSEYPRDPDAAKRRVEEALDAVAAQGFRSLFMSLKHSLLSWGAKTYDDHGSEEPDLAAFALLDHLLLEAHARGMTVHFWLWGDEERRETPAGLEGGVGGDVDLRLQRYLAARLGPLPGWSMAYGFDLEEWTSPSDVRAWAAFLQSRMQLPHLLTAREKNPRGGFDLGDEKLSMFSVDDRPSESGVSCYDAAVARLTDQDGHEPAVPVLFERRFVHGRDGHWSQTRTHRCLWQLTMAGGAGAVWGEPFSESLPYPNPSVFDAFFRFWDTRFRLELERVPSAGDGWTLRTPDRRHHIVYVENADRVTLDLAGLPRPSRAVALDTASGETIALGELAPARIVWGAPHRSDWAIAVDDE